MFLFPIFSEILVFQKNLHIQSLVLIQYLFSYLFISQYFISITQSTKVDLQ